MQQQLLVAEGRPSALKYPHQQLGSSTRSRKGVATCRAVAVPRPRLRLLPDLPPLPDLPAAEMAPASQPAAADGGGSSSSGDGGGGAAAATDVDRRQRLLACAFMAANGASGAAFFPFLNVYLASPAVGMSASTIGLLSALRPALAAPAALAASAAADRWRAHAAVLTAALASASVLRAGLPLAAAGGGAGLVFAVLLVSDMLGAPAGPLGDAVVLSRCRGDGGEYGSVRLWASLGYGLASLPAGALVASSGGANAAFAAFAVIAVPLVALAGMLRYDYSSSSSSSAPAAAAEAEAAAAAAAAAPSKQAGAAAAAPAPPAPPASGGGGLAALLRDPRAALFFARTVLLGASFGVIASFEFVFLSQECGASATLLGLAIAASICTEVPAFRAQAALQRRFGATALLNLAAAATALRLLLYAALPLVRGAAGGAWPVLAIDALHGLTFALGFGAGISHAPTLVPESQRAQMVAIFQGAYAGLGAGLGGLAGGVLMERAGGQGLFVAAAACVAVGSAAIALAERALLPRPAAEEAEEAEGAALAGARLKAE